MKAEFSRAAASYDAAAVLARETGKRLAERLSYTKIAPARFADVGCATGDGVRVLQTAFPRAQAVAIDLARPMLQAVRRKATLLSRLTGRAARLVQADVRRLPLADGSLGLVWSNLMLHWLEDPLPAFRELHRVLETGGLLTFAMLGPDTLKEWRKALEQTLPKVGSGGTAVFSPPRWFPDMHDIGDMLLAAGFGDPVMDRDDITLTYASARALIADQRHLGVRNAIFGGAGQGGWRHARSAFSAWPRGVDGRLSETFEIVYGQAWKPAARAKRQTAEAPAVVKFYSRRPE